MALSKPPAKLDLGDYLPYLVNRVGNIIADQFGEEALAPHGLSIAMWRVMAALASTGGQRQIDLADLTSIDSSTLSAGDPAGAQWLGDPHALDEQQPGSCRKAFSERRRAGRAARSHRARVRIRGDQRPLAGGADDAQALPASNVQ